MNDTMETKVSIIENEMKPIVKRFESIQVKDVATYTLAGEGCKSLTSMENRIKEYWKEDIDRLNKTHKSLVAKKNEMLAFVSPKKKLLIDQMKIWEDEQTRIAKVAEDKANAEAKRIEEEAVLEEAEELEHRGKTKEAEEVIDRPIEPPHIAIPTTKPKGYGAFTKKTYSAVVYDKKLFCRGILNDVIPEKAIQEDSVFLNIQARSLKFDLKYPGVRVIEE